MPSKRKALEELKSKGKREKAAESSGKSFFVGFVVVVVLLGTTGVLAGLNLLGKSSSSFSSQSPPVPDPPPPPLQLSKENIYAGSRLLAVEDAGATQQSATDLAVWRKSSGTWWVMNGLSANTIAQQWGADGDVTAPADFDGDSKTDFCVYRPSNQTWYIINSSTGTFTYQTFGISTDKPVPSDYDGDGRADIAK